MTDAELNAVVAEMMRWKQPDHYPVFIGGSIKRKKRGRWEPWTPATNIAQAMEVLDHVRYTIGAPLFARFVDELLRYLYDKHGHPDPEVGFVPTDAQTIMYWLDARAICLAALAAHHAREGTTREVTT